MDAAERERLIKRYREGHRVVMDALEGITDEELDRSASGEWTPRMVAHHLGDSEMMSALRLRRLLTEAKHHKRTRNRPIRRNLIKSKSD